jgi:hypothetical protein
VFGLDAGAMKPIILDHKNSTLLEKMYVTAFSGRLAGNKLITYALVLSYSECSEDIQWMLNSMKELGINLDKPNYTLLSDRGTAIIKAVSNSFTFAYSHYCSKHLERNLKAKGFGSHLALFWEAACATTVVQYKEVMQKICARFLYSRANTTPQKNDKAPVPFKDMPSNLDTPELRNQWNMMPYNERISYIQRWWHLVGKVLPFQPWRTAWSKTYTQPPIKIGKKSMLEWLYKLEQGICKNLTEQAPHDSFYGLCKEIRTYSSSCNKSKPQTKTCRTKKKITRESIRKSRMKRFGQHGGVL